MSALGGKADIKRDPSECPLMTQSGHLRASKAAGFHGLEFGLAQNTALGMRANIEPN